MEHERSKTWSFAEEGSFITILYTDGAMECGCLEFHAPRSCDPVSKKWTPPYDSLSCQHTRAIQDGTIDTAAKSSVTHTKYDMPKNILRVWTFASSSGSGTYETLLYDDGSMSCSCHGWCRRIQPDGTRTCKHLRIYDQGRADAEALSSHDYTTSKTTNTKPPTPTTTKTNGKAKERKPDLNPYLRKFDK